MRCTSKLGERRLDRRSNVHEALTEKKCNPMGRATPILVTVSSQSGNIQCVIRKEEQQRADVLCSNFSVSYCTCRQSPCCNVLFQSAGDAGNGSTGNLRS